MISLAIAFASLAASTVSPSYDAHLSWDAVIDPVRGVPDFYEVEGVTNILQWQQPVMGCYVLTGKQFVTKQTALGVNFTEAAEYFMVRAWYGIECSDWGTVRQF
jgi:hypothetical protein